MANVNFLIKRGLKANLDTLAAQGTLDDGCWYVTTDTQQVFVCIGSSLVETTCTSFDEEITQLRDDVKNIAEFNGLELHEVDTFTSLPADDTAVTGHVYKCVDSGMSYKWNGSSYDCIAMPADKMPVETFGYRSGFPAIGQPNILYVAIDEEKSYIWNTDNYLCVSGKDGGAAEVDVINGGTAEV